MDGQLGLFSISCVRFRIQRGPSILTRSKWLHPMPMVDDTNGENRTHTHTHGHKLYSKTIAKMVETIFVFNQSLPCRPRSHMCSTLIWLHVLGVIFFLVPVVPPNGRSAQLLLRPCCCAPPTGEVGRHMLLVALRTNRRQTYGRHIGSQKLEENGRRRIVW